MTPRTTGPVVGGIIIAAIGAILTFAVTATVGGLDISTVGVILMVAGIALVLIGVLVGITSSGTRGTRTRTVEERVS